MRPASCTLSILLEIYCHFTIFLGRPKVGQKCANVSGLVNCQHLRETCRVTILSRIQPIKNVRILNVRPCTFNLALLVYPIVTVPDTSLLQAAIAPEKLNRSWKKLCETDSKRVIEHYASCKARYQNSLGCSYFIMPAHYGLFSVITST